MQPSRIAPQICSPLEPGSIYASTNHGQKAAGPTSAAEHDFSWVVASAPCFSLTPLEVARSQFWSWAFCSQVAYHPQLIRHSHDEMAISVMVLYTRRPDFSPDQFKTYMERTHLPIIKEVMGNLYPAKYPRRYVERVQSGAGDRLGAPGASRKNCDPEDPVMLVGSPKTLEWDMMGEMVFRDELHLQQCLAVVNSMEGQRIKDDEENFTIPHLLKVALIGESFEE